MKCAICGNRTLRPQRTTIEGKGEVLVCQTCYNKLGKTREQTEKPFRKKCPKGSHWDDDLHQCVKDRVPTPKIEEQKAAKKLKDAIKHGKTYAYVTGNREKPPEGLLGSLNRRSLTKSQEQVHLPAPQVPARPVTVVGPITVEQKIDALQAAVTELERQMANVLGMLGIRAGRS